MALARSICATNDWSALRVGAPDLSVVELAEGGRPADDGRPVLGLIEPNSLVEVEVVDGLDTSCICLDDDALEEEDGAALTECRPPAVLSRVLTPALPALLLDVLFELAGRATPSVLATD